VHDDCYSKCEKLPKGFQDACFIKCDRELVACTKGLDDDCTKWTNPPRKNTESDSQNYRDDVMRIFNQKVRDWDNKQKQSR
jgi:hypothetical protein